MSSVRTTVTLDEDVLEKVKHESRTSGATFRDTLNNLLRMALLQKAQKPAIPPLVIVPHDMGLREGLSLDNIEELISWAEGEDHR